MSLINKITIKNFRSFREKTSFRLGAGSYFIGINNAGKSTILNALRSFFDENILNTGDFINKTSFLSKKRGSNVAEITIAFNLQELTTKKFKQELIRQYGQNLSISKIFTVTTDTRIITHSYKLNGQNVKENFSDDIKKLLGSIKVTYLHPQEGQALLTNAQEKLRQRLLANWGRGSNITHSIEKLQNEWVELRNKSKTYLSGSLTESLQKLWPGSEVSINLPKNIREIITVSDINFSGYKGAPEIDLTSQGTGAQSTILYLTHFLLDSDRSLHRGEYHPLWLLEEPESFLHVDLLANLSKQLNSEKWLNNIQMVISTHSPVLLAGSRLAEEKIVWSILSKEILNKPSTEYTDDEIKEIGTIMGDPNFFAYFLAAKNEPLIFIEDSKNLTVDKYRAAGIKITKGLKGVSEIVKFIDVFVSTPWVVNDKIFFIIDSDKGKSEFSKFYDPSVVDDNKNELFRFKVTKAENLYLIFLPEGLACESLFAEFKNHIKECISKLWDTSWMPKDPPIELSGVAAKIRAKRISTEEEASDLIQNEGDIKNEFWRKVNKFNYKIEEKYITALKDLTTSHSQKTQMN